METVNLKMIKHRNIRKIIVYAGQYFNRIIIPNLKYHIICSRYGVVIGQIFEKIEGVLLKGKTDWALKGNINFTLFVTFSKFKLYIGKIY